MNSPHLGFSLAGRALSVRPTQRQDSSAILHLHRAVFGSNVDPEWFDWKYGLGGGQAIGVWDENQLIAHCGGVPRTLLRGDDHLAGLQICDVMVDPSWRGVLTRQGPFFHACQTFYTTFLGSGATHQLGFGFPNQRHLQLAVKTKLSWHTGDMQALRWPALNGAATPRLQALRLSPLIPTDPEFEAYVSGAWHQMTSDAAFRHLTLGQRDAKNTVWRYTRRPDRNYIFFAAQRPWAQNPHGILVFQQPDNNTSDLVLLDWIGAQKSLRSAIRYVRQLAGRLGLQEVSAWASPAVAHILKNSGETSRALAACIGVPIASAITHDQVAQLNWWLMAGDTDFL